MAYTFREDITTADVCFDVEAKTLENLFKDAALAIEEVMVDLKSVKKKIKKEITLENTTLEKILFDFLEELIYLKDAEQFLASDFEVKNTGKFKLKVLAKGEKINKKTMKLRTDVKAVTLHQFIIKQEKGKWFSRVILDI